METKTCPHCGGAAFLHANYSLKTKSYFVFVKCVMCGSQGRSFRSPDDPEKDDWDNLACLNAVHAWNARVAEGA